MLSLTDIINLLLPRRCVGCGCRLSTTENLVCAVCLCHLPRTRHWLNPTDNNLVKLVLGRIAVERAASYFHYERNTLGAHLIHAIKYHGQPEVGTLLGRVAAAELTEHHFFDNIDTLIPVPLARRRQRERGYNQSLAIAQGIANITHLPIERRALVRTRYEESQTKLLHSQRLANVDGAFELKRPDRVAHRHVLLIDDVITTGATISSAAIALATAPGTKVSIFSLGYAYGR